MGKRGVKFSLGASARRAGFSAGWPLKIPVSLWLDGMLITNFFLCSAAMRARGVVEICAFLGKGNEVFQLGADLHTFAQLEVAVAGE